MKTLKFLFAGAIAIAVLFACSEEEKIEPEPEPEVPEVPDEPDEPTEEDYAAAATISSDDTYFAFSEEDGYTVSFKTEGGAGCC
ncbi:MAG: hypothetical protein LUD72_02545 [Bacteroidales bacterium]|nr:hypothetical protein [Bacteroidales bacterium]